MQYKPVMKSDKISEMGIHDIQAWKSSTLNCDKTKEEFFEDYSSNKFGNILKATQGDSLICNKFANYWPEYQRLFAGLEVQKINMLEIGVQHGGSYRVWKNYFGEDLLSWTGIDIDPKCLALNNDLPEEKGLVLCGNQADDNFLEKVVSKRGTFDVVIDDGSHHSEDIVSSFKCLAKHVAEGGLYIVEDIHACYWSGFRGESDSANALSYFLGLAHSLNIQAIKHKRCSKNLSSAEIAAPTALIRKIELIPSMVVCYMGSPLPMIEWRAGTRSVIA